MFALISQNFQIPILQILLTSFTLNFDLSHFICILQNIFQCFTLDSHLSTDYILILHTKFPHIIFSSSKLYFHPSHHYIPSFTSYPHQSTNNLNLPHMLTIPIKALVKRVNLHTVHSAQHVSLANGSAGLFRDYCGLFSSLVFTEKNLLFINL